MDRQAPDAAEQLFDAPLHFAPLGVAEVRRELHEQCFVEPQGFVETPQLMRAIAGIQRVWDRRHERPRPDEEDQRAFAVAGAAQTVALIEERFGLLHSTVHVLLGRLGCRWPEHCTAGGYEACQPEEKTH